MVPWDRTPEFLAATNTTIIPGGPTAYSEIPYLGNIFSSLTNHTLARPRQTGNSPGDVTAFHPGQVSWSKYNMPDILYVLRPSDEWYKFSATALPPQKLSGGQFMFVAADGTIVLSNNRDAHSDHQRLLDFKILPDKVDFPSIQPENFLIDFDAQIGTCDEWWFFEAVRRLDPRLRWEDILMRMEPLNRPTANAIQERSCRTWRPAYCMISWHLIGRFKKANDRANAVIESLSQDQLNKNTTRGSTPGLVSPHLGEAGGRVPLPALKLGAGLSRLQARRVREEHRMNQLQGIGMDNTSEDPSGEAEDIGTNEPKSNGLASTTAEFSHDDAVGKLLPGIQNGDRVMKRVYSSRRPSNPYGTGSSSNQARRARRSAVTDNNDQNGSVSAYASVSTVHTPRIKRQREDEVQDTEPGNGVVKKRRRATTHRPAITPVFSSSTAPQPRALAFAGPWLPPSSFQPSIIPYSSASEPHLPVLGQFFNNFPTHSTTAAEVVAEPGRVKQTVGPYMHTVTNAMASSDWLNRPVSSARNEQDSVTVYGNHFEGFHPTQGYQRFRQESTGPNQSQSAINSAAEYHGQANSPGPSQQGQYTIPDPWIAHPVVDYDVLARQSWQDLQDAINFRVDPEMSPYDALDI